MHHDSLAVAGPEGAIRTFHWPGKAPGSAPALLFVHGMLGDASFWTPTIEALGEQRPRAIAAELRGHGSSEPAASEDYSPRACAADLLAVLDGYGLDRATVIGHSYGALVALAFAAAHPERVARLVLADPPGDFTRLPPEARREQLEPFLQALAGDGWRDATRAGFEDACAGGRASTRETIFSRLEHADRTATVSLFRPMFEFDAIGALDTFLAHEGASAHAILAESNAWPFSLHVLRPSLPHTVMRGTGHWLMLDDPAGFASALRGAALGGG
ncbi:MAG TPA: alpha/beta fold hydrolase [Gemmatimonadaceae bacterium]|nr:alpha/beta fold hydrolase [Gemmatimonadaceae bacterium]